MIDLHCHMLPGIDDGAVDLPMALAMARMAAADGIHTVACTPHIYPGLYENDAAGIERAVAEFQREIDTAGIALRLTTGADAHLSPELGTHVAAGLVPTLSGSRYLLLEPPHHVAPPHFEETVFNLMANGLVPVITHPERLSWVADHYEVFARLADRGCWMQITAGALTGRFGRRVRYWGERFVGDGRAHVLATDAHHPERRPPLLAEAREAAAVLVGREEADRMVLGRPAAVLADLDPSTVPPPDAAGGGGAPRKPSTTGMLASWLRGRRGRA